MTRTPSAPGDERVGCDLRVAVDLPPRGATGDSQVRYVKAVAFGVLASHAAESVRKGDRVPSGATA
jgi:single-stranded DNA-binding protein